MYCSRMGCYPTKVSPKRMAHRVLQAVVVLALVLSFVMLRMPSSSADTYFSGRISENTTWTIEDSPYWIVGDVTIDPGVMLTIEPGVQVLFTGFYYFEVQGFLLAIGSEDKEIIFTSGSASPQPGDWNGILVWTSGFVQMRHVVVSYGWGLSMSGGFNNTIESSLFHSNHGGVEIFDSSSTVLRGNTYRDNVLFGVSMSLSHSYNLIEDSTFESNDVGLMIDSVDGTGNLVRNNSFTGNLIAGIAALDSQGFEIRCNLFFENFPEGLTVYNSTFLIHHNNFLGPIFNAHENGNLSMWDDGSEGNYWIDYDGNDSDGDGIGDTPYQIPVNSYDYYPLMTPAPCCPGEENLPPVAVAKPKYQEVEVGEDAWFCGNLSYDLDGSIVSYTWDFGDGSYGEGPFVWHSYQFPGQYYVTLWVVDDDGLSDSDTATVLVQDNETSPMIIFTDPPDKSTGIPLEYPIYVCFNKEMDPFSLVWNITPDPGGWNESWSLGSTCLLLLHSNPFEELTTYTVEIMEAEDIYGNPLVPGPVPNPWEFTTLGGDNPPVAFAFPDVQSVSVGEEAWFDGNLSYDPDGVIVDYAWDFGDGSHGNGVFVTHAYDFPGSYNVELTVTDDDGLTDSDLALVFVDGNETYPFITFTIPVNGDVGVKLDEDVIVWFSQPMNASTLEWTIDPDPGCWNETWIDDMMLVLSHCNPFQENTSYIVHIVYAESEMGYPLVPGPVLNPWSFLTTGGNIPPVAEAEPDYQTIFVGNEAWFDGGLSYDPDGFIVSYLWDFGDGATAEGVFVTHAYDSEGNYTVTLTVWDNDLLSDSDSVTVIVLQADEPDEPILVLSAGLMNIGTFSEGATRTIPVEVAAFHGSVTNVHLEVIEPDGLEIRVLPDEQDVPSGGSVKFYLEIEIPLLEEGLSVEGRTIEIQAFGDQATSNVEYIDLMIRDKEANIWWTPETVGTVGVIAGSAATVGVASYLLRRRP